MHRSFAIGAVLAALLTGCGDGPGPGAAPVREIDLGDGRTAPLHLVRFDKRGDPRDESARSVVLQTLREGDHTDLFIICHGWNNTEPEALERYDSLLAGYERLRAGRDIGRPYRPLYVGIVWPSTALVFPWEDRTRMLAVGEGAAGDRVDGRADLRDEVATLAEDLSPEQAARLNSIAAKGWNLDEAELRELASISRAFYGPDEVSGPDAAPPSEEELLLLWTEICRVSDALERGLDPGRTSEAPEELRGLSLDIRKVYRLLTFRQMKDRAGVVGEAGVGPLLDEALEATGARVHFVGHSYGCKVGLAALCSREMPRPIDSVLLLQPAVSAWCFADDLPDPRRGGFTGRPGRYADAPTRTKSPILATFSRQDSALHRWYHLFQTRDRDIGERVLDTAPAPSLYCALGGYGPQARGSLPAPVAMKAPPDLYDLGDAGAGRPAVVALDGSGGPIPGHGGIVNEWTQWALYSLVAR